jgi:uncharacterized membrane protein
LEQAQLIRVILLFGLVLQVSAVSAQELPAFHAVTGVAAGDALNLHVAPNATAAVVGTLAPDATGIEVVDVQGGWAEVSQGDITGFANLRYLRREDGPDWNALQTPLACIGTEPFWSLEIDPAAGETRYRTPEDTAPQIAGLTEAWPGVQPWAPSAAVGPPTGLAVLQPLICSDGMSDRSYGIVIDLFLDGATSGIEGASGRTRLSGCCRMVQP